ncbi:MAG: clan AA aspartic protease [Gemmatimonadetes bacterium]|jgi:clan AA aspartic protease|nr:clan AA aspartic protease [Gemmatimonadota bacterium]
MITGFVTPFREAVVSVKIQGAQGTEQQIDAVIDTGYNGALTLPLPMIRTLGLPWRRRGRALLADGRDIIFDTYEATLLWDGQPCRVAVDAAAADPLVGMALLQGFELTMQVVDGGHVTIESL